jgi:hypothetical protein
MQLGFITGFIGLSQEAIACNYSANANSHTTEFRTASAISLISSFPKVVFWNAPLMLTLLPTGELHLISELIVRKCFYLPRFTSLWVLLPVRGITLSLIMASRIFSHNQSKRQIYLVPGGLSQASLGAEPLVVPDQGLVFFCSLTLAFKVLVLVGGVGLAWICFDFVKCAHRTESTTVKVKIILWLTVSFSYYYILASCCTVLFNRFLRLCCRLRATFSCRCSTLHVSAYMAIFMCVWCFAFLFLKESASLFLLNFLSYVLSSSLTEAPYQFLNILGQLLFSRHERPLGGEDGFYHLNPSNQSYVRQTITWPVYLCVRRFFSHMSCRQV